MKDANIIVFAKGDVSISTHAQVLDDSFKAELIKRWDNYPKLKTAIELIEMNLTCGYTEEVIRILKTLVK